MARPMPREAPVTSALRRVKVGTRANWAKPGDAESQKFPALADACCEAPAPPCIRGRMADKMRPVMFRKKFRGSRRPE
jgi:hypothetical protein